MDENKNLNEIEEAVSEVDAATMNDEELRETMKKFIEKERGQSMILGYRVACTTIMQLIAEWHAPGASKRQYERIFKKVEEFCSKALKQDDNDVEDTTEQNDEE